MSSTGSLGGPLGGLGGVTGPRECVICGALFDGHGHNADPVAQGRCCDLCNFLVIEHRMMLIRRELAARRQAERAAGAPTEDKE